MHLSILEAGHAEWNQWRADNPHIMPRLTKVSLREKDLRKLNLANVDFAYSDLRNANLKGGELYQCEFFSADLTQANLNSADLRGAKLHNAILDRAELCEADLFRADFISTSLIKTNFERARCWLTAFSNVDLSRALGLSGIYHSGPSSIDISTLYKSLRNFYAIPSSFLRDSGLPDELINTIIQITKTEKPKNLYSCFISYSHTDERS
jgi:uncharacterized protein YjbI with pentapeptide repeats